MKYLGTITDNKDLVTKEYVDNSAVTYTLDKHTDTVIGSDATFKITQPTVTVASGTTGDVTYVSSGTTKYMKATASGTAVTPTTTNIKATASGANTAWNSKDAVTAVTGYASTTSDTFVKTISKTDSKLITTSIPNVTGNTSVTANKSTWTFTMGTGNDADLLIIGGGNGSDVTASKVTLGTAITAATGSVSSSGAGASVVTSVSSGTTASALTGLGSPSTKSVIGASSTFTVTQPTVALATGATAGTGVISVATGITSVTQPTVSLSAESSTASGRAEFIQSVDTTKKLSASAINGKTEWNNKDSVTVLTSATNLNAS